MTEHQEKLVRRYCILYSKSKLWFKTAFPCMTGYGDIFFIEINGSAGGNEAGDQK